MPAAALELLRTPRARWTIVGSGAALFALFFLFDRRNGGMEENFAVSGLAELGWMVETFGAWYVYGSFAINALVAIGAGALLALAVERFHDRRRNAAVCSTTAVAPLFVGFAAFTCPGCILPITGLLGASVAGTALPLLGLEFKIASLVLVVAALAWGLRLRSSEQAAAEDSEALATDSQA